MRGRFLPFVVVGAALVAGCENDTGGIVNAPPGCGEAEAISASGATSFTLGGGASGPDLMEAMGMDEGPSPAVLQGQVDQSAVFPGLGDVEPTQGSTFAWMSTGIAGAGTDSAITNGGPPEIGTNLGVIGCAGTDTFDCVTLTLSFVVPSDHHGVRFDFEFFSTEFPEFIGAGFNDNFTVSLASTSFNFPNISFDEEGEEISIDNALFTDDDCEDFEGTGFDIDTGFGSCDGGSTGPLGTIAPVAPGETVTLTFRLIDEGDGFYDSAVMIDHLQTTPDAVEAPETNDCD